MKKMLLMGLMVAIMAGLSATTAMAQRSAGAKVRGDFGHGFWSHNSTMMSRGNFNYQAAPVMDSNRSFSYEPTPSVNNVEPTPCGNSVEPAAPTDHAAQVAPPAAPVANNNRVTQRFSYEPAPAAQSVQTYRSYRSTTHHKSSWEYPKTDPRRYSH